MPNINAFTLLGFYFGCKDGDRTSNHRKSWFFSFSAALSHAFDQQDDSRPQNELQLKILLLLSHQRQLNQSTKLALIQKRFKNLLQLDSRINS